MSDEPRLDTQQGQREGRTVADLKLLQEAAQAGDVEAMYRLGVEHEEAGDGASARLWLEAAAAAGDDRARSRLGLPDDRSPVRVHGARANGSAASFTAGQTVEHDRLGLGTVLNAYTREDGITELIVQFGNEVSRLLNTDLVSITP